MYQGTRVFLKRYVFQSTEHFLKRECIRSTRVFLERKCIHRRGHGFVTESEDGASSPPDEKKLSTCGLITQSVEKYSKYLEKYENAEIQIQI